MKNISVHVLNNGGKHDGEECTYTVCYTRDPNKKNRCLGWCKVVELSTFQIKDSHNELNGVEETDIFKLLSQRK